MVARRAGAVNTGSPLTTTENGSSIMAVRSNFEPAARKLAERLVAIAGGGDWVVRLTLFLGGCSTIDAAFPAARQDEILRMLSAYAKAVIEAFGSPPVTCGEQAAIWSLSTAQAHRAAARRWLWAQGGRCLLSLQDGAMGDLTFNEDGDVVGHFWSKLGTA
jgi:hypothetical protein